MKPGHLKLQIPKWNSNDEREKIQKHNIGGKSISAMERNVPLGQDYKMVRRFAMSWQLLKQYHIMNVSNQCGIIKQVFKMDDWGGGWQGVTTSFLRSIARARGLVPAAWHVQLFSCAPAATAKMMVTITMLHHGDVAVSPEIQPLQESGHNFLSCLKLPHCLQWHSSTGGIWISYINPPWMIKERIVLQIEGEVLLRKTQHGFCKTKSHKPFGILRVG